MPYFHFMRRSSSVEYVINNSGKKKAVILDLEEYRQLLEDYHDLQVIASRKENPKIEASAFIRRIKSKR